MCLGGGPHAGACVLVPVLHFSFSEIIEIQLVTLHFNRVFAHLSPARAHELLTGMVTGVCGSLWSPAQINSQ